VTKALPGRIKITGFEIHKVSLQNAFVSRRAPSSRPDPRSAVANAAQALAFVPVAAQPRRAAANAATLPIADRQREPSRGAAAASRVQKLSRRAPS